MKAALITEEQIKAIEYALEEIMYSNSTIAAAEEFLKALAIVKSLKVSEPVAWRNRQVPDEFYEYEQLDPMWHHHYRPLYAGEQHDK